MLSVNEKKAVIAYRRQKAYDTLTEANEVAKLGYWSLVGNVFIIQYSTWLPLCYWIKVLPRVLIVV